MPVNTAQTSRSERGKTVRPLALLERVGADLCIGMAPDAPTLDVILVPGVCFDTKFQRVRPSPIFFPRLPSADLLAARARERVLRPFYKAVPRVRRAKRRPATFTRYVPPPLLSPSLKTLISRSGSGTGINGTDAPFPCRRRHSGPTDGAGKAEDGGAGVAGGAGDGG